MPHELPTRFARTVAAISRQLAVVLIACVLVVSVRAQDPMPAKPVEPVPAPLPREGTGDIIYLPGPEGKYVPVLVNGTLREYLEFLKTQQAPKAQAPAAYSVSSLSFTGTCDDERVQFTVKLRVQTHVNDWVRVPLQMPEAFLLREPQYEFAAAADQATNKPASGQQVADNYTAEQGYAWWFQGVGNHSLQLEISVPIRKAPLNRRFQLSLPATAVSSLKLTVPQPGVVPRTAEKSTLTVKSVDKGTEVEVFGLGRRLDLSWQLQPEVSSVVASLESTTMILATLVEGESLTLEATQTVKALRGSFNNLKVTLPPEFLFQRLRVDGQDYTDIQSDAANPLMLTVRLKQPTSGPVELKWTVGRKIAGQGKPISIEGFSVDRAQIHTGFIAVAVIGDFLATRLPEGQRSVEQQTLAALPVGLRQPQISSAFRILDQPFRLALNLQRIEPNVSVEPQVHLLCTGDGLELDATYRFHVYRGSISEVQLNWPNWKSDHWVSEQFDPPNLVEEVIDEGDQIRRIRLVEPTRDDFVLHLRARRTLPALPAGQTAASIPFAVPSVVARQTHTEFNVASADNLEVETTAVSTTGLRLLNSGSKPRLSIPLEWQKYRSMLYRIDTPQKDVTLQISRHEREVKAQTELRVSPGRGRLSVSQKIQLDVAYDRLSQLRLRGLPQLDLENNVKFSVRNTDRRNSSTFDANRPAGPRVDLTPTWVKSPDGTSLLVQLPLDQPRQGRFELEVRYELNDPLTGSEMVPVKLPVLNLVDTPFQQIRCEWMTGSHEAAIQGVDWVRQPANESGVAWTCSNQCDEITLNLTPSSNPSLRGGVISQTLIQTGIDASGTVQGAAHYRITGGWALLRMTTLPGMNVTNLWWNGTPLNVVPRIAANGGNEYEIMEWDLPTSKPRATPRTGSQDQLLTVTWHMEGQLLHRFTDKLQMPAPRFPELSTTETLWEVTLPQNQHLFSEPVGFAGEYRWQFNFPIWQRVPARTRDELRQWVQAEDGPVLTPADEIPAEEKQNNHDGRNRYVFSRLGAPIEMQLRTMTGTGVVVLGFGFCAFLALLLFRWPATRHLLTVIFLGLAVSIAALWFPSEVAVLLQPAIAGATMAMLFATVQQFLWHRRRQTVLTITAPSGFLSHSNSSRDVLHAGSDDHTQSRIRPGTGDLSNLAAETGSRT